MLNIDPEFLHTEIALQYMELLNKFKSYLKDFTKLKLYESIPGENMYIECVYLDICEDEQYYTFFWNHTQKGEKHIIDYNNETFELHSKIYSCEDLTYSEVIRLSHEILYKKYCDLHYMCSWISQLTN